jgi:flagellar hook-associated protein 2
MTAIRITGMASGLPPNIVDQIMEGEKIPLKQMEASKTKEDDKVKLVTDLETRMQDINKNLTELVGTRGFTDLKLSSGDPSIIDGVADPTSGVTGTWAIEVLQLAQKPGAISNGFPDKDKTQFGTGYLKFKTPEGIKEVYINGKTNTLEAVVAKINSASVGVRAQVINDRKDRENPFKLLVTGLETGDDMQVDFPTVYLLDGDQDMYFDSSNPAQNAKVKLDGFEVELPDNTSTELIPGVTVDLKQSAPGRQVQLKVKENLEVISGKIKNFVEAYNKVFTFIQDQHKLVKGPDGKERLGPMGGDGLLRTIEAGLRRVILNPQLGTESTIKRINEMGIEFSRNGTLNLNMDKFNSKLSQDPKDVAKFLRGDGVAVGFVPTVKTQVKNALDGAYGPIPIRKRGLQTKIDQLNKRIESKERQLEKKEDSLRQKFANLETQMSRLNQQGTAVAGIAALGQKQG